MKNSLKTLQRIQKFAIDEQRKILNEYLTSEERLLQKLHCLTVKFEEEKEFCSQNGEVADFGPYLKRYLQHRDELEAQIHAIRVKIAETRDVIADMFKEQKTYEIVDSNRARRRQQEFDAKEQKTLDEIGTNTYIKRKEEN